MLVLVLMQMLELKVREQLTSARVLLALASQLAR
jgi:hypothetical protein